MENNCVFCKIVRGEIPAAVIYEDDLVLAFLDIAPLNKGHALLIPKAHAVSITTVADECLSAMMRLAPRLGVALMRAVDADGFNLILSNGACAGQVVAHAHLHVVPRFPDDGIVLPARAVNYDSDDEKQTIISEAKRRLSL